MWWWLFNFPLTLWVFADARRRRNSMGWAVGCLLLAIVFLPLYLAKRSLKEGETREGGTGWNTVKYFALFWTILMFLAGISATITVTSNAPVSMDQYEAAGYAIGAGMGLTMIAGVWFAVIVGALVIGLFLKRSTYVENGPTGRLQDVGATKPA